MRDTQTKGADDYRLVNVHVHPMRRKAPIVGKVPMWSRYVVIEPSGVTHFPTLHGAIVYHGVATGFSADLAKVHLVNGSLSGEYEPFAVIGSKAAVDWSAYGWR